MNFCEAALATTNARCDLGTAAEVVHDKAKKARAAGLLEDAQKLFQLSEDLWEVVNRIAACDGALMDFQLAGVR